jgi:hypothetical protein
VGWPEGEEVGGFVSPGCVGDALHGSIVGTVEGSPDGSDDGIDVGFVGRVVGWELGCPDASEDAGTLFNVTEEYPFTSWLPENSKLDQLPPTEPLLEELYEALLRLPNSSSE